MDGFEEGTFCMVGRMLARVGRKADLADDPELWAQVWERCRSEVLPQWVERNPGRRPEAFHEFETGDLPEQEEGETEIEWLFRCGLLEPDEFEAIRQKAKTLAEHNRSRRPDRDSGQLSLAYDELALYCSQARTGDTGGGRSLDPAPDDRAAVCGEGRMQRTGGCSNV